MVSSSSSSRSFALLALGLGLSALVAAQDDAAAQLDPAATCPYELTDQIQQCRATVYADEAVHPGGPCSSTDWACICNVQQGLVACYAPCPGTAPATDVEYNNANCAGQNGVTNAAAASGGTDYSGSTLTTTVPADLATAVSTSGTSPLASTTSSSGVATTASTTSSAISVVSTSSASPSTPTSSPASSSAASSTTAPNASASANVFGGGAATGLAKWSSGGILGIAALVGLLAVGGL